MKKFFLLLTLATALNFGANAQDKKVSFGVKAGLAFPNLDFATSGVSLNLTAKTSFYVGAVADVKVSNIFSVQPGLIFSSKGAMFKSPGIDDISFNFDYLELPLNLVANFQAGPGKFFAGAGPYAAYAISGNQKAGTVTVDADFGSDDDEFKRMDVGLNLLTGYQLKNGLSLNVGYGIGLGNIYNDSSTTVKNKVFSVGLGFMF